MRFTPARLEAATILKVFHSANHKIFRATLLAKFDYIHSKLITDLNVQYYTMGFIILCLEVTNIELQFSVIETIFHSVAVA